MLAVVIHLNRGTPYVYMGEEIGMLDPEFCDIEQYKDVECLNAYRQLIEKGNTEEKAFKIIQAKSRDNSRVPMQWNASEYAGFSKASPWLSVAESYKEINVEKEKASGTILPFYKELIRLRKKYSIISQGEYRKYAEAHPQIYAFLREDEFGKLFVANNFYGQSTQMNLPQEFLDGEILIGNYDNLEVKELLELRPYETVAIYVKK